ncbi:hypothetical protein IE81DRAFT_229403 [Ceraceosorus guamensis]|uniref:Uncharacterized protein n=1 Tax=Ceraceosorus guamensis TaxID=1522189 RepID=A0A316WAU0_9BASI|nr:hypothetical protein IE81DRAFT_229403 [Ceraceosorus guamensis]PWN45093.1 hypothetical protein IE81DRAFT_229403 [Ceraceosorus guamensis]
MPSTKDSFSSRLCKSPGSCELAPDPALPFVLIGRSREGAKAKLRSSLAPLPLKPFLDATPTTSRDRGGGDFAPDGPPPSEVSAERAEVETAAAAVSLAEGMLFLLQLGWHEAAARETMPSGMPQSRVLERWSVTRGRREICCCQSLVLVKADLRRFSRCRECCLARLELSMQGTFEMVKAAAAAATSTSKPRSARGTLWDDGVTGQRSERGRMER